MTDRKAKAPPPPEASISTQTASGVLWMTVQKWAIRVSGLVTIAILTRFLRPEDFGTVAAASTVLPFFYLLSDIGFAAYIVQADRIDRRMLSTSFWFSFLAGLLLAAGLVGAAPLFGLIFRSDEFVPVLQALSLTVVFTSMSSVPMALLRRAMRFRALAVQGTAAAFIAQAVAVAMTLTGFGIWALVGQALASQVVMTGLAWYAARWFPAFTFSRREFSIMARFGSKVLGVEFVAMCRAWGEAAIISATLGMAALGYLNIAQRLVQIVQDLTGAALVPVATVAFAKIRESTDRLRGAYVRALRMTYAAMSPPLTLLAVAAPLIVPGRLRRRLGRERTRRPNSRPRRPHGRRRDSRPGPFLRSRPTRPVVRLCVVVDTCTVAATAITAAVGPRSGRLRLPGGRGVRDRDPLVPGRQAAANSPQSTRRTVRLPHRDGACRRWGRISGARRVDGAAAHRENRAHRPSGAPRLSRGGSSTRPPSHRRVRPVSPRSRRRPDPEPHRSPSKPKERS